jgi:hypothetical protein
MSGVEAPVAPRSSRARVTDRLRGVEPAALVQLLAIIPMIVMLDVVLDSSQLPWFDYWDAFTIYTAPDGDLKPLDLLFFANGHVVAVPALIQWINFQLTGGESHAIGFYVMAIVVAQFFLLRSFLPRPPALGAWWYGLLVVAIAVLLFAPQGAWNFSRAASGAGWLTANLLTIIAIAFAVRGRYLAAIPFAGLASISYGTGLMAWPVLLAIVLLRGRWSWRSWAVVGGLAATFLTYMIARPPGTGAGSDGFAPNDIARRVFQVLGGVLSPDPEIAPIAGAVGIGLASFLIVACWRERSLREQALPFIAVAIYAACAAGLIGIARGGLHEDDLGVASRYASLSILLWLSIVVLFALRYRHDARAWIVGFVVTALAFASGQPTVNAMRASTLSQDELAIAMRLGLSEGYTYAPSPEAVPMFKAIGHYPFTSEFDDDCGLLGKRIDAGSVQQPQAGTAGHLDRFEPAANPRSVRIAGWFGSQDGAVECVVLTDGSLRVIGAGSIGHVRPDVATASPTGDIDLGFVGVAPAGEDEYRAFAIVDGEEDRPVAVPGILEPSAAPEAEPAAEAEGSGG